MWDGKMDGSSVNDDRGGKQPGPHVEKRLNAAFVKKAPPGRHTDGGGLYLQVDESGARRWILRVVVHGKRRDFGLGSANVISLADARDKSFEMRRLIAAGGNPKVRKREDEGRATTFAELAKQVHHRKFKDNKNNGKHIAQWINTLETYAFPTIGDLAVEDVNQDDIERVIDPIWTTKPETARRVLQRIKTVFDHACGRGLRTRGNPTTGMRGLMRKQDDQVKHFTAIEFMQIDRLFHALKDSKDVGALALLFTLFTASRSGPVRAAVWSEIDPGLETWTIPAAKMKTKKEFVVPLSMPARDVLLRAKERRTGASDLIFPSPSKPKNMISENTMRKLLQTIFEGATVHGLRSTFRTWVTEIIRVDQDVAELCLAHAVGGKVERAYNRPELIDQRLMMLEKWGLWATGDLAPFSNGTDVDAYIRGKWIEPI